MADTFRRDVFRVAEFLGLSVRAAAAGSRRAGGARRPLRDVRDKPYIHRLTRLGAVAEERGRGIELADEGGRVIWSGTPDWHTADHLAAAARRAGLDLAERDEVAEKEVVRLETAIAQNQTDHEAAGHWGVPTCAFRGEPFFGQDRLDVLLWRLRQHGLVER